MLLKSYFKYKVLERGGISGLTRVLLCVGKPVRAANQSQLGDTGGSTGSDSRISGGLAPWQIRMAVPGQIHH